MCGLAGGTMFDEESLGQALKLMSHRGRDWSDTYHWGQVWLGHNRLAIQDLSRDADQPYECGDCVVVFNGELWRSMFDRYGDLAGTKSDTKLLMALYHAYGDDPMAFARCLDGMFAFAIHDRGRGRLVLGRDRLGRIPLYVVARGRQGIAFASEAKALHGPLGKPFHGNHGRGREGEVTLFAPGHIMVYDLKARRVLSTMSGPFAQYSEVNPSVEVVDRSDRGPGLYASMMRALLESAVHNELVSDVPVCTILSGGIDSTVITALLAQRVPGLEAFTVSCGDSDGADDLHYARRAARMIGVPLNEVIVDPKVVAEKLESAVWQVEDDRWTQVAPAVLQIEMAKEIGARGFKVVFGGEGADELFAAYAHIRRWSWEPEQYHHARLSMTRRLHDNNLIRGNKAMMAGTVELRTPFLDARLVDFCLGIPTKYRDDAGGRGRVLKPLLREAFRDLVPDEELRQREKVPFQEGAHTDFLKRDRDVIVDTFHELFTRRRTAPGPAARAP